MLFPIIGYQLSKRGISVPKILGGGCYYPHDSRGGINYPQDNREGGAVITHKNPLYLRLCKGDFKFKKAIESGGGGGQKTSRGKGFT